MNRRDLSTISQGTTLGKTTVIPNKLSLYGSNLQPAPVVTLTVIDYTEKEPISIESQLLIVVRDPLTNIIQPDVVSMPTKRIPRSLYKELVSDTEILCKTSKTLYLKSPTFSNLSHNGHYPVIYVVEAILAQKLGVANALISKEITFEASIATLITDIVSYDTFNEEEKHEQTSMLNIQVLLTKGNHFFPKSTASYSYIFWESARKFLHTARSKNTSILRSDLSVLKYCIHGLCIWSSYNLLALKTNIPPYRPE